MPKAFFFAALSVSALWGATAPLVGDAHASGATNFGASSLVNVGGATPSRGYFQFDVAAALPAGTTAANIAKANLVLFVNKVNAPGVIDVNASAAPWNEGTITGNNAPGLSTPAGAGIPISDRQGLGERRTTEPWLCDQSECVDSRR